MTGRTTINRQTLFLEHVLDVINILFLGSISQPATQPYTHVNHSQSDCSEVPQSTNSQGLILFQNIVPAEIIRRFLPRLPKKKGKPIVANHDLFCLAFDAASTAVVKTKRSAKPIGRVPDFRKAFV